MPCALMAASVDRSDQTPRVRLRRRSTVVTVAVVETRYAVPGWGVGELWSADGVVLAHDFRFGPASDTVSDPDLTPSQAPDSQAFRALLDGVDVAFEDVALDLEWATPFQRALADALRAVPRGEVVTYGELAALAGRPRAARAAGAFCAANRFAFLVPCHRVVSATGIGGYGDAGVEVKRRLLALEGVVAVITSEDVREELAAIAPQRECDRRAELSALFHSREACTSAAQATGGCTSISAAARPRGGRSRSCATAASARRSERTAAARSTRATRYQLHVAGDDEALRVLAAAGVVDRRHAPLERPPRRVVARSCCRAAYLRGAFLGAGSLSLDARRTSSCARPRAESATLLVRLAHAEGVELAIAERSTHSAGVREELGGDRVAARAHGRDGDRARARGACGRRRDTRARQPARERRPREPRPHEPLGAGASSTPSSGSAAPRTLDALPDPLREAAELRLRHPTESLRELAARADPPATKAALHRRLRALEELRGRAAVRLGCDSR